MAHPKGDPNFLQGLPSTSLVFQAAEHQQTYTHETSLQLLLPLADLPEVDRSLFKGDAASLHVLVATSTIFHPQGGGQPSDVGSITVASSPEPLVFDVLAARTAASNSGVVLHFGKVENTSELSAEPGTALVQSVDEKQRLLFSRLHTAGHVLGSATRTLLEEKIEGFDELKASHFPDSAACEFKGIIEGKWKPDVQQAVDALVDQNAEVRIEWWTKSDFREHKLDRLIPPSDIWRALGVYVDRDGHEVPGEAEVDDEKTRIRVVNIVGAEAYPCGGTHVPSTKACGHITVKKISGKRGTSRVSYSVE